MEKVFYDLSSTTFSGYRCTLMKWGHCKGGYHRHAVLALVVNPQGLPFYWEVLPGNTADVTTMTWLLKRLNNLFENMPIEINPTLVFDRGMVSHENLALLEIANIKYISAMDKNQIEGVTGIDFQPFSHLQSQRCVLQADELENFDKLDAQSYYREIGVKGTRRYILCFNPQLKKAQRLARQQAVDEFRHFVGTQNRQLLAAKKSRQLKPTTDKFVRQLKKAKLNGFVDVELTAKELPGQNRPILTYQAQIRIDTFARLHTGRLDGFWLLVIRVLVGM
ncbi:MAG: transposase [Candidatus Poribacteria bacterium]|nr:transposase [Candidatus Poribacteria bacterium]